MGLGTYSQSTESRRLSGMIENARLADRTFNRRHFPVWVAVPRKWNFHHPRRIEDRTRQSPFRPCALLGVDGRWPFVCVRRPDALEHGVETISSEPPPSCAAGSPRERARAGRLQLGSTRFSFSLLDPAAKTFAGAGFFAIFLSIFNWWAWFAAGPFLVKAVVSLFDLILIFVGWQA